MGLGYCSRRRMRGSVDVSKVAGWINNVADELFEVFGFWLEC